MVGSFNFLACRVIELVKRKRDSEKNEDGQKGMGMPYKLMEDCVGHQ